MPHYNLNGKIKGRPEGDTSKPYLSITPAKVNGIQLPDIEWFIPEDQRKPPKFKVNFQNLNEAKWFPKICIDSMIPVLEYKAVIEWWFDEARKNEEYSKSIQETFKWFKPGILDTQTNLCKGWLLKKAHSINSRTNKPNARKKDIDSFLINWLTKELNKPYNIIQKNKKW